MAHEIFYNYETGNVLYFCTFQRSGQVWLSSGADYEPWGTGIHDADDYDESMGEKAPRLYIASFPIQLPPNVYDITVYLRAGANPADTDFPLAQGEIYWDGVQETTAAEFYDKLLNVYDET